ncbi:Polyketide cyclase SnoaL-like [Burkholderiaceae bacterium]
MTAMSPKNTSAHRARASSLRGFDAEFRDLDHYIRVITDRIWEGGRIDDIRTYYSDPCIVDTPSSVSTTVQAVIDGTRATLTMFPDRRLLAEDIIQSGDADGGFLSSHRIISTMTHRGDGVFGPATGKRVHARTIADCVCKDNQIVHEWLVRDQGAIALQIGLQPRALAQQWLNQRGGWNKPMAGHTPHGYTSHVDTRPAAQAYAKCIEAVALNHSLESHLYDEAVHHIGPCETTRYGHAEVTAYWHALFNAMQVEHFSVEHLALNQGGERPDRIALRWRAKARHTNRGAVDGMFGVASGQLVEIMGINHVEIVNGKVLREWVLIDDVALWMQVLSPQT